MTTQAPKPISIKRRFNRNGIAYLELSDGRTVQEQLFSPQARATPESTAPQGPQPPPSRGPQPPQAQDVAAPAATPEPRYVPPRSEPTKKSIHPPLVNLGIGAWGQISSHVRSAATGRNYQFQPSTPAQAIGKTAVSFPFSGPVEYDPNKSGFSDFLQSLQGVPMGATAAPFYGQAFNISGKISQAKAATTARTIKAAVPELAEETGSIRLPGRPTSQGTLYTKLPAATSAPGGMSLNVPVSAQPLVQKFKKAIEDAPQLAEAQKAQLRLERGQRIGGFEATLNQGPIGERAATAFGQAMAGQVERVGDIVPIGPAFSQAERDILFNIIQDTPSLDKYDIGNLSIALRELMNNGTLPQPNQLEKLQDVFGPGIMGALAGKNSTLAQKIGRTVIQVANLPRAFTATGDWSNVLLQQGVVKATDNVEFVDSLHAQFKAFANPKYKELIEAGLKNTQYIAKDGTDLNLSRLVRKWGLQDTFGSYNLGKLEEAFISHDIVGKIPIIKNFEAGYVTGLNKMRYDMAFREATRLIDFAVDEAARLGKSTDEVLGTFRKDGEAMMRVINKATGRGTVPGSDLAAAANSIFFSPRYFASRLQLPLEIIRPGATRASRIKAAQMLTVFTAEVAGTLYLMKLAGMDVELDPRSTNFGRGKLGNSTYDLTAGYSPIIRFAWQEITGERKSTDKKTIQEVKRIANAVHFGRTKLAPAPAAAVDAITGETLVGESYRPTDRPYEAITPFTAQNILDALREGSSVAEIGVAGGLSFFGAGVSTYRTKEQLQDAEAQKLGYQTYAEAPQEVKQRIGESPKVKQYTDRRLSDEAKSRDAVLTPAGEKLMRGELTGAEYLEMYDQAQTVYRAKTKDQFGDSTALTPERQALDDWYAAYDQAEKVKGGGVFDRDKLESLQQGLVVKWQREAPALWDYVRLNINKGEGLPPEAQFLVNTRNALFTNHYWNNARWAQENSKIYASFGETIRSLYEERLNDSDGISAWETRYRQQYKNGADVVSTMHKIDDFINQEQRKWVATNPELDKGLSLFYGLAPQSIVGKAFIAKSMPTELQIGVLTNKNGERVTAELANLGIKSLAHMAALADLPGLNADWQHLAKQAKQVVEAMRQ